MALENCVFNMMKKSHKFVNENLFIHYYHINTVFQFIYFFYTMQELWKRLNYFDGFIVRVDKSFRFLTQQWHNFQYDKIKTKPL